MALAFPAPTVRHKPVRDGWAGVYRNGHYGAALLAYAPLAFAVTAAGFRTVALVGGALALALATVPDMDIRVPGIDHRGPTHTVWFAVLVAAVVGVATGALGWERGLLAAAALGGFGFLVAFLAIGSHVAADALTPMGVTPFTPVSDRHISYGVVRAKNPLANWLLLAAGVISAAGAFALALSL